MSVNIGQLKKQLQNLGISTNTPGLLGDDRYEELRSRLDEASNTVSQHGLSSNNPVTSSSSVKIIDAIFGFVHIVYNRTRLS